MIHYLMLLNFSIYNYYKTEGYDYHMADMAHFMRHMDGIAIHIKQNYSIIFKYIL
jgi:hypothetical protein